MGVYYKGNNDSKSIISISDVKNSSITLYSSKSDSSSTSITHYYTKTNGAQVSVVLHFRYRFVFSYDASSGSYKCTEFAIQKRLNSSLSDPKNYLNVMLSGNSQKATYTNMSIYGYLNGNKRSSSKTLYSGVYNISAWTTEYTDLASCALDTSDNGAKNISTSSSTLRPFIYLPVIYIWYRGGPLKDSLESSIKLSTTSDTQYMSLGGAKLSLTFDADGGTPEPEDITLVAGNTADFPGSPTKENTDKTDIKVYFIRNYDSSDSTPVGTGSTKVDNSWNFTGWKSDTYTWTSGSPSFWKNHDFKAIYVSSHPTSTVDVPSKPDRDNYSFNGWWSARSGGTNVGGESGETLIKYDGENNYAYAHWDPDDHTITVNYAIKEGEEYKHLSDDEGKDSKTIKTEYGKTVKADLPSIWGYNTPTKVIDNSTGKEVDATKLSGDADNTYIAVYSPKINTIVFNLNQTGAKLDGVEMKSKTDTYTIRDGEIIKSISEDKKVINIFTKYRMECYIGTTTYCFLGWNTKADGSGAYISYLIPSDKNSVSSWGTTLNLYAQWLPLGKYVFYEGGWRGILNSWIYTGGTWKGWISGVDKKELITSNLTTWVRVKDPNDPEKLIWVKEYGNIRIS